MPKTKTIQFLCGIFTVAIALTIHTWVATMAWFATYLGPRIGAEATLAAVTAYQDDMLPAILPLYLPMILVFGIHFVMLLTGKHAIRGGCLRFIRSHGIFCWPQYRILRRRCRCRWLHGCP